MVVLDTVHNILLDEDAFFQSPNTRPYAARTSVHPQSKPYVKKLETSQPFEGLY